MVFAMQVREWIQEYSLDSNEVSQVVGRDFILQSGEMSLSASSLPRNGCIELLLGVESKGSRKGGNQVVRTGPAEATRCAFNGAMVMCNVAHNIDEQACNDFPLLSR